MYTGGYFFPGLCIDIRMCTVKMPKSKKYDTMTSPSPLSYPDSNRTWVQNTSGHLSRVVIRLV